MKLTAVQLQRHFLNVDLNMQIFLWLAHCFLQEHFSSFKCIKLKCAEWKRNRIESRVIAEIQNLIQNENMKELSSHELSASFFLTNSTAYQSFLSSFVVVILQFPSIQLMQN